jgi:hypothetical protein
LFELDDVMAGIGIECKKNLPDGTMAKGKESRGRRNWTYTGCGKTPALYQGTISELAQTWE